MCNAGFKWGRKEFTFYGAVDPSDKGLRINQEVRGACRELQPGFNRDKEGKAGKRGLASLHFGVYLWSEACSKCVCYRKKKQI